MEAFSLNDALIKDIFHHARPLGHHENLKNLNLGFGFLYYGAVRALRPRHTLVIGSGYGFTVVCLALGIKDNGSGGLTFVDPSYALLRDGPFKTIGGTGQWDQPEKVHKHFKQFGLDGIVSHHKLKSEEFFAAYQASGLPPIDLAFIDGNHSYSDVRHDFQQTCRYSRKNTYIFLHDTNTFIRETIRHSGVNRWLKFLKQEKELFEVINFPFSSGVALVRLKENNVWEHLQ
ncbi:class I SAM-dependent methyltransferase [Desulfoferrobacter suflitae]|uniref:class I SAM-dependent methyltransferase n=1 Tax=Desulfoferrobacter suflitae TaxID=2865782 RepID=UPI0021647D11|nr:class I SAM-dependent methyltransferase [Desulfoferrobacter suflitae]MCK8600630.1 class I SAM-dependent methyltransferase [Desulfoferrobacter suflitae]